MNLRMVTMLKEPLHDSPSTVYLYRPTFPCCIINERVRDRESASHSISPHQWRCVSGSHKNITYHIRNRCQMKACSGGE